VSSIGQLAALVAAAIHVLFFVMESVRFTEPATYQRFFVASQADAETLKPFAFNQGFYNLFLAVGAVAGVIALNSGHAEAGRALILLACGSMAAAGIVLVAYDRRFARAGLIQAIPPLVAIVGVLVG
jgi:putative membrane protein